MLSQLRIRDFAIIDELALEFAAGFNVLTGETGAGKSIIMQAVDLLCGGRSSPEVVRSACDEASIEGLFELAADEHAALEDLGVASEDDLLVRRVISRSGKSRVYLNGGPANLALLERIGRRLIHVYGQHDQSALLRPDSHLDLLDGFAAHGDLVATMVECFGALEERLQRLAALREGQVAAQQRAELIRFQLDELEAAAPEAGEDERLQGERQILVHAEKLAQLCQEGEAALYSGEDALGDRLARVGTQLRDAARIDASLAELGEILGSAQAQIQEVAHRLRTYGDRLSFDPARLEAVDERLAILNRLKRKHGGSLEKVLEARTALADEIARLDGAGVNRETLEKEIAIHARAAWKAAAALSASRREAATRLEKRMIKEIRSLGMLGASFGVVFSAETTPTRFDPEDPRSAGSVRLSKTGADAVEFYLSANPGEAPKPLAKVASGGELSRLMLALKVLTAGAGEVSTLIFDEVDAGIGGQVAYAVGDRLHALGQTRQVLCITHLPQIAARATHHFVVEKQTRRSRTVSMARQLNREERVTELSRMLGGGTESDEAARFAQRLVTSVGAASRRQRSGASSE